MRMIFLSLILSLAACTSQELTHGPVPNPAQYNFPYWVVKHIDASDGIERYEARFLAHAFFTSGISGCGAPGDPEKKGNLWVFPTYVGYGASPDKEIVINSISGDVEYNGKKTTLDELQSIELLDLPKVDI